MTKFFLYARKSTESEDRQVLSLDAQIREARELAEQKGLTIVGDPIIESKSAKMPNNRPNFIEMLKRIQKQEANSILSWNVDRLSRNAVDTGWLVDLIDRGLIQQIVTHSQTFRNTPNDKCMLSNLLTFAKLENDNRAVNVRRGFRAKLNMGWRPGLAPIGYLNDKSTRTIIKDPMRFPLVKKMWQLFLAEEMSVPEVLHIATSQWGLCTKGRRREGGKPLARAAVYRMFGDPFYCGLIRFGGDIYPGKHPTMITRHEFDRVQRLLGRNDVRRPKRHQFTYTGLIHCGECGASITAEHKTSRHGHRYIYYHCTKRKSGVDCDQKCIRVEDLESQIVDFLERIKLKRNVANWCLARFDELCEKDSSNNEVRTRSITEAVASTHREVERLTNMKLRELLTDQEYLSRKERLLAHSAGLQTEAKNLARKVPNWFEPARRSVILLTEAKNTFGRGDDVIKRRILQSVGSNLLLKDRSLLIQTKKPFNLMVEGPKNPFNCRRIDEVRTFFSDTRNHFYIPRLDSNRIEMLNF